MKFFSTIKRMLARAFRWLRSHTPRVWGMIGMPVLLGLAILAALGRHNWWPSITQAWMLRGCWAALCLNILTDARRGQLRRPAGVWQLAAAGVSLSAETWLCMFSRMGWSLPVVTAYILWKYMPWNSSPSSSIGSAPDPDPNDLPDPDEIWKKVGRATAAAAAAAEAAAAANGASTKVTEAVAAAAAEAVAAAAAQAAATPAPAPTPANIAEWRREVGLVKEGKWYFGRIPYTHFPLFLLSFKLEGESVTRRFFFVVEDPETFNDIENLDVTPDLGWGRIRGCVTLRILPKKIGVPVNDVWHLMPTKFARALLASWKLYKVK